MDNAKQQPQPKFEQWAIIELMGHQQIAGFVTEATIAGGAFVRVDVPNPDAEGDLYTRYLGTSAIYAINPTTEKEVRSLVSLLVPKPPTPRTRERRQLNAGYDPDGQGSWEDPVGEFLREEDEDDDIEPDANRGEIGF